MADRKVTGLMAVSRRITLQPGGKQFDNLPGETLLESGLQSGLNLPYNCNNGNCGSCKAKLLSGQLGVARFHDYPLSEAEKLTGYFLLCRNHAASDLVVEVQEIHRTDEIPHQQIKARVQRLQWIGAHTLILQLRTPRSQTLRFLAGQSARLTLPDGHSMKAPIASCPCNGMYLQFHLPSVYGSHNCLKRLACGEIVTVDGPSGDFLLDEESNRTLLFIAHNHHFAAVKSLIEHAINLELENPIHLYWLADEKYGHYQDNICRSWVDALDHFSYQAVFSTAKDSMTDIRQLIDHFSLANKAFDLYAAIPERYRSFINKSKIPQARKYIYG